MFDICPTSKQTLGLPLFQRGQKNMSSKVRSSEKYIKLTRCTSGTICYCPFSFCPDDCCEQDREPQSNILGSAKNCHCNSLSVVTNLKSRYISRDNLSSVCFSGPKIHLAPTKSVDIQVHQGGMDFR